MWRHMSSLSRILSTAAFVSLTGGLLLSYQWGHTAHPPLVKVTPASPEMMRLLRDEHRLIANMVKLQIASEQRQVQ